MLDQPAGLLERMRISQVIVEAVRAYSANWNKSGWIEEHPDVMKTMIYYWDLREKAENGTVQT